jgi:hypothetical protein
MRSPTSHARLQVLAFQEQPAGTTLAPGPRQIAQQEAEVASAAAQTQQARAELAEAGDNRKDLTISSLF